MNVGTFGCKSRVFGCIGVNLLYRISFFKVNTCEIFTFFAACLFKPGSKRSLKVFKDSVVQLYGIVMTTDSLRGLESVKVVVKGQGRGTITNDRGVFSIVVLKGDQIEFTSVGFKPKTNHPKTLEGNQQSVIQLMINDTVYLPATINQITAIGTVWAWFCESTPCRMII